MIAACRTHTGFYGCCNSHSPCSHILQYAEQASFELRLRKNQSGFVIKPKNNFRISNSFLNKNNFQISVNSQKGITLLISMIVMALLMISTVTALKMTNVDLQIATNVEFKEDLKNQVEQAMEQSLNNIDTFMAPADEVIEVENTEVSMAGANCINAAPADGYSASITIVPENTFWQMSATAEDPVTGARVRVHQGVRIKLLAGSCES